MGERLGSAVFYGDGKVDFPIHDLPAKLQLAPIFSFKKIMNTAINENDDIAGGNFFDVIPYEGRYDAQPAALFTFNKKDSFNYIPQENLANIKGEVRDIQWIRTATYGKVMMIARNNNSIIFLANKKQP